MADAVSATGNARDGRSTRWDPHRRERRVAIVAAAIAAIEQFGPDPVTAQIAEKAGIPRTHVYRHFNGRDSLDRAVVRSAGRELLGEIRRGLTSSGTGFEVVRNTVDAYLAWVTAHPNLYRFLATRGFVVGTTGEQDQDDAKIIAAQEIRTALQVFLNEDNGAAADAAQRVALAVIGAVDSTAYWWIGAPEPKVGREELADDLADISWLLIQRGMHQIGLDFHRDDPYPPDLEIARTRYSRGASGGAAAR